MKKAIFFFVSFTVLQNSIFPQAEPVTNTSEKFNKRGIIDNQDFSVKGNEIISEFDGNVLVKYSTPINLPNDLSGEFTVMYNPNVEHRMFKFPDDRNGNMVNSPEWILGFKGFALQTLNFENNFFIGHDSGNDIEYFGEEVPMLIPGYHFSNRMNAYQTHDYLKILMADGTIKVLYNITDNSDPDFDDHGIYVEPGINDRGFAIVEQPDAEFNRIVYYKPGDGLTYMFEEEIVDYYDFTNSTSNDPRILYLKKIFNTDDPNGDYVEFEYNVVSFDVQKGRLPFSYLKSNRRNSDGAGNELDVFYGYSNYLSNVKITNYNTDDEITLWLEAQNPPQPIPLFGNGSGQRSQGTTNNLFVINVVDKLDRPDSYSYYDYSAGSNSVAYRQYFDVYGVNNYIIQFEFHHLLNEINYHNSKKTELEFWDKFFAGSPPSPDWYFDFSINDQQCKPNMEYAYRDCFTNFMLQNRKVYDKYNGSSLLTKEEEYSYTWEENVVYDIRSANVNDIITNINILNKITGSSDPGQTVLKNYTRKRTEAQELDWNVRFPEILLVEEIIMELEAMIPFKQNPLVPVPKVINKYNYDFGSLHTDQGGPESWYFDGSFWLEQIIEEKYDNTSSQPIFSLIYNTTYPIVNHLEFEGNIYNKKIPGYIIEDDPNMLSSHTSYKNYLPPSPVTKVFNDINYYYFIGKTESKEVKHVETVKSFTYYEYYDNVEFGGEFYGKLKKVAENLDRPSTINYYYYTQAENDFYRGFLKYSEDDKGVINNYYYPNEIDGVVSDTASGKVVLFDSTDQTVNFQHNGFQMQPFRTVTEYGDGKTFVSYASYNPQALLAFEIDINGYYSHYTYDELGRVTNISLPGSFLSFQSPPSSNYSVIYEYDDDNNILTETNRTDNDPSNLESIVSEYEYDSYNQLRKISVENDGNIFEMKSETDFNFLGMKSYEKDGRNYEQTWYNYDYLSRLIKTSFIRQTGPNKTMEYKLQPNPTVYYDYEIHIDEVGNERTIYYDNVGNKVKDAGKITEGNIAETNFSFNSIYELINVTSPEGKVTTYSYDDLGNIRINSNPDEGITNYKYNKYSRLRFSLNSAAPSKENALLFNSYDDLNRKIITGQLPSNYGFENLIPDNDYPFEELDQYEEHFVQVNMYDEYLKEGVFENMPDPEGYLVLAENLKGRLVATAFRDELGKLWSYKTYSYDALGRVNYLWVKFEGNDWKQITTKYDNTGNVTFQDADGDFYYWYEYDVQGRLMGVRTNEENNYSTSIYEASYDYYANDFISRRILHNLSGTTMTNTDYIYDTRGWLVDLRSPSIPSLKQVNVDRFREELFYFDNGNIQTQTITNSGDPAWQPLNFAYEYDGLNRLIDSEYSPGNDYSSIYEYDKDGNLTRQFRYDKSIYYYFIANTNKIDFITYNGPQIDYTYDYKGNVIDDGYRGIAITRIDYRNLPLLMSYNQIFMSNNYDEAGLRIVKNSGTTREYYLRDHTGKVLTVYDLDDDGRVKMANLYGDGLLGHAEVTYNDISDPPIVTYDRYYYFKDHLGSIRLTIDENATIAHAQDYYPFGDILREYTTSSVEEKYKFTGKERDVGTGYDYFGARYYDSFLGRWMSVDPLAGKYPGWSPYNYSLNNPVNYIDPDGLEPNKKQSGTWRQIRAVIVSHLKNSGGLQSLRYTFGDATGKQVGPFGGNKGLRYIHTKRYGWIDMAHLTQGAAVMQSKGITGFKKFLAKTIGRNYALGKLWETTEQFENAHGGDSNWSYEDGPSNLAGMNFYLDYYGGDSSQEIIEAFDEFFNDAQATKPEEASNWDEMQSTPQTKRRFKQNKSLVPVTPEPEDDEE